MRILLFGNPSTMHSNLAKGLRERGHEVRCISHRTGWRMFPVDDILLERRTDINGKLAFIEYLLKALPILRKCKGYDIVQLNGPMFLEFRGSHLKWFYDYLRSNNSKVVLGAFGDDYHIVERMLNGNALRYSDQKIGDEVRMDEAAVEQREEWIEDSRHEVGISKYIAADCDAIVACLYEYWACYREVYPDKTFFLPLPVIPQKDNSHKSSPQSPIHIFIGIQKERSKYKGTDIMLKAARDIKRDNPELVTLQVAENVPYAEYEKMLDGSDILLDQLYSYTPSMNSLLAMSKGIVVVGGGEPENYDILEERELRPIINVQPSYESVYNALKKLVLHKDVIPELKRQSVEYVTRHHDYRKVAEAYESFYRKLQEKQ